MLVFGYGFWSEWELQEKVDFDGSNRIIRVLPHVTNLDIREDVWSAYVRWAGMPNRGYDRYLEAMDRTGLDDTPVGQLGNFVFLRNGWKLYVDFEFVKITGVLFSRDFDTAYYTYDGVAQYAAQVSSIVNETSTVENVVTGDLGDVPTKEEIAAQVWAEAVRTLTESAGLTPEESAKLLSIPTAQENADTTLDTIL